jgi:hypothetical protein
MVKSVACLIALFLASTAFPGFCQQQTDNDADLEALRDKVVRVETLGGGTFQGKLLATLEDRIELLNNDGQIVQISRTEIKKIIEIKPEKEGNLYFQDASSNRLIIIPTGFGMEEGEFHIADLEIVGVTSSYGISRNFSVWGGVSIPGAVFNARYSFTLAEERVGTSVGSFLGVNWFNAFAGLLIPYLITSVGSENRNITIGAGSVFIFNSTGAEVFSFTSLVAVLGGKLPFSSTTALISENWIVVPYESHSDNPFPAAYIFPSVVFRIAGNRLSWDIGATIPCEIDLNGVHSMFGGTAYIPIPLITVTYRID